MKGKALDTAWDKDLLSHLHSVSHDIFCSKAHVYDAYLAYILSSDDRSEKNKFNIVQSAHLMLFQTFITGLSATDWSSLQNVRTSYRTNLLC